MSLSTMLPNDITHKIFSIEMENTNHIINVMSLSKKVNEYMQRHTGLSRLELIVVNIIEQSSERCIYINYLIKALLADKHDIVRYIASLKNKINIHEILHCIDFAIKNDDFNLATKLFGISHKYGICDHIYRFAYVKNRLADERFSSSLSDEARRYYEEKKLICAGKC